MQLHIVPASICVLAHLLALLHVLIRIPVHLLLDRDENELQDAGELRLSALGKIPDHASEQLGDLVVVKLVDHRLYVAVYDKTLLILTHAYPRKI